MDGSGNDSIWVLTLCRKINWETQMKDIRIDSDGELCCWKCGFSNFLEKRTARSKVLVGVGSLVTKKKLKCQVCGEYNDTGNAKPYTGAASKKYQKMHEDKE